MFKKIAVLGAGTMGQGIAEFFARNKLMVTAYETNQEMLSAAQHKYGAEEEIIKYLSFSGDLREAVSEADLIIESVTEDIEIKRSLYRDMTIFLKKDSIVSSNTSTYPLATLAFDQSFASRMIITHFFNPPQLIPLVELVQSTDTLPGLMDNVTAFLRSLGKVPVVLKKDCAGFIANRLQAAILREACFLLESGVAEAKDIDHIMTDGIGLRWAFNGPFKIADLGGLDVWEKVCGNLFPDLSSENNIPGIIKDKVKEGKTGLKTLEGFYKYEDQNYEAVNNNEKLLALLNLKETRKYK